MIRGENLKDHVSGWFETFHPGTTSQNFRTTEDRDLVSSAKLFGMISWVNKSFDVRSITSWWDDLVAPDDIFLKESLNLMNREENSKNYVFECFGRVYPGNTSSELLNSWRWSFGIFSNFFVLINWVKER